MRSNQLSYTPKYFLGGRWGARTLAALTPYQFSKLTPSPTWVTFHFWGLYWIRTSVYGFADRRLSTRQRDHFRSSARTRTGIKWSVVIHSNPLNYRAISGEGRIRTSNLSIYSWFAMYLYSWLSFRKNNERAFPFAFFPIFAGILGLEPRIFSFGDWHVTNYTIHLF